MSFADRWKAPPLSAKWLVRRSWRFVVALAAVAIAALIRHGLGTAFGFTQPFVLFGPIILLVAILDGFWLAFCLTLASTATGWYFFLPPRYSFVISGMHFVANALPFLLFGLAMSITGGLLRRRTQRLQEFEKAVQGVEDMIVVVDRNYRYLIANDAFLSYRGMKMEEVIGHHLREVLTPGVFESLVKDKIDECFGGKTVQYELRYEYPLRGERDLLLTYFPVEGKHGIDRVACVLQDMTDLRQSERSLRLFRTLIDESNDSVLVIEPESYRILDANEKACRDLGYTRSELLSMASHEIEAEPETTNSPTIIEKLKHGEPLLIETVYRKKDGSKYPVESSLKFVGIERNYIVAVSRDISERLKSEAELRKSEEHFRILVEQASDGIFVADAEGRYIDANSAGLQMLGYSREELVTLSVSDVVAESEIPRIASEVGRFAGGATVRSEWMFRRKDGSCFPGEVSGKQLPDGRLQGILRDLTERRQAEQDMRRSEERFRVALKDSPITVFNQDCDLRYTWIYNPQLYWQDDVLGKTDEEVLGQRKSAKLTSLKRQVLTTGLAVREEVSVRNNGKGFAFDMTIEPLFDAQGNVVGITGACMDIAKIRELADRLQDSRDRLEQEKSYLETEIRTELGFENIIGESSALREVLKKARIVAPTDSTVLLLGETGTGKELVARSLHWLSSRRDKTFVKLNCAAVPSGLLESELFGHEKGAFTGAVSQKIGRIELADKGTLFLDEIGELPPELQPKLLRVLQDREFERLGGIHTLRVDVRIISATNRELLQDVLEKRFREDLYYRLNVFPIQLPPLRDRREDIPVLVQHFVEKHARLMGKHIDTIPDESIRILENWRWPGNIRELENMIERMTILTTGHVLAAPPAGLDSAQDGAPDDLTEMEREHIVRVLRETNGVLSGQDGAAVRLGLKRTTLQSMLKRFGIEAGDFRRGNGTSG